MTYSEIQGDLFQHLTRDNYNHELEYTSGSRTAVYCHCIANDAKWGAGIAPIFINRIFQSGNFVKDALALHTWDGRGWCAFWKDSRSNQYGETFSVYEAHLITKELTSGKPTYKTIIESLLALRQKVIDNSIYLIRMPKIGCGLDKLEWDVVSGIIQGIFSDLDVTIEVYYL